MTRGEQDRSKRLDIIRDMIVRASTARVPGEVARIWATQYWKVRPVDVMVTVSRRGCGPEEYRITGIRHLRDMMSGEVASAIPDVPRPFADLPIHRGGLVGTLVAEPIPRLLTDLEANEDPVLGGAVAGLRSVLAIPIYDQGEALNWTLQFRKEPDGFQQADLESSFLIANLVGHNHRRMVLSHEVQQLNAALREQFEQVARVQRSLLPRELPSIPGLSIATSYLTSEQAGGDYYDFFPFPDGRWGILIADVSGHGAAAATIMAMLHGILHAYAGPATTPGEVMSYANSRLVSAGIEGTFVTAFFGIYDPRLATLTYARCGHNPPIHKDGSTGEVRFLDGRGSLPLGVLEPFEAVNDVVSLRPLDTIVLYTDGITEAFDAGREMFGPERLDAALTVCSGAPDCVMDSVHAALFKHTGSLARNDDQTLVALRFVGAM
ncbi:MAG: PP2C family protein-serine/threonine phosphatase [Phycisphaerales bacterium]